MGLRPQFPRSHWPEASVGPIPMCLSTEHLGMYLLAASTQASRNECTCERKSKLEATVSHSLILEMNSIHFSVFYLLKRVTRSSPHLRRSDHTEARIPGDQGHWDYSGRLDMGQRAVFVCVAILLKITVIASNHGRMTCKSGNTAGQ